VLLLILSGNSKINNRTLLTVCVQLVRDGGKTKIRTLSRMKPRWPLQRLEGAALTERYVEHIVNYREERGRDLFLCDGFGIFPVVSPSVPLDGAKRLVSLSCLVILRRTHYYLIHWDPLGVCFSALIWLRLYTTMSHLWKRGISIWNTFTAEADSPFDSLIFISVIVSSCFSPGS